MTLPWFRFDSNFPQHDKVLRLIAERGGRDAAFVYVCGLAYCATNETDGLVPFGALPFVHGRRRDATLLVANGMWKPHPDGWEVVNYLERQPSASAIREGKSDRTLAGRKAACIRWHGDDCGCWGRSPPDP